METDIIGDVNNKNIGDIELELLSGIEFTKAIINSDDDTEGTLQIRPGIMPFLEEVGKYYELIVFTAATQEYADPIINALENNNKKYFDCRLYRIHTIIIDNDFVKDLSKLGRDLSKTLIVDNLPQNFRLNKENGIKKDEKVILFVGRISKEKGMKYF